MCMGRQAGSSVSVASDAVPAEPLTSPSNSSPSFRGFVAPELGAVERSINDIGSPFLPGHGGAYYFNGCRTTRQTLDI